MLRIKKFKTAYSTNGGNMLKNTIEYKRFVWELNNVMKLNNKNKKILFLCIGTTKIIGDSFGPAVGSRLKQKFEKAKDIEIIGNLEDAFTYDKIEDNVQHMRELYPNCLMVAIDSALSEKVNVGKIFIQNRGLKYAESLKKNNQRIR